MPSTKASVSYGKQNGSLTVSDDKKYLFFTPSTPPGASPAVTIPVAHITNLQQTGPTKPKVALKVFVKDESHVFTFTSKESARKEQEAVTDVLKTAIAKHKEATAAQLVPAAASSGPARDGGDGGQSAAMAIAKAISSKAGDEGWFDDNKLKSDFQLQRSLLGANQPLNDRFIQSLHEKPDSVSTPQFTAQFWSTRLHLLRAHAIEKAQKEGEYNVLPAIKHKSVLGEDGQYHKTLNITKDQIALLFKQYPIVRKAYNDNCPPLTDNEFYARFFGSRLLKKLKGERIERHDPQDATLDKYLDYAEGTGPAGIGKVPHFIDLEGNEQNSKFTVNREGWEMSATRHDQPILHVLNNLSEKMLSHVAPEDGEAHGPIGMDEETFNQLRLRDLARNDADNRVVLNVREQQRYLAGHGEDDMSADARLYAKQDPSKVLSSLQSDLQPSRFGSDERGTLRLDRAIATHSDGDSGSEDDSTAAQPTNGTTTSKKYNQKPARIGSDAALTSATSSILTSVSQRRHQTSSSTAVSDLNGLSQSTFDTLTITHNTTTEFLHYFWSLFLSGDSTKSSELAGLVTTLDRSLDRINAVGQTAEKERQEKLEGMRIKVREYYQRTGKRRKIDESVVGGGKGVVDLLVGPTVRALGVAVDGYRRALEEQTRDAAASAAVAG